MNEQNKSFKNGDIVRLKSGGPWMTINELYNNDKYARCIWFDKDQKLQEETFSVIVIVGEE